MEKLDLYKQHIGEYAAGSIPRTVEVSSAQYLAIEGAGEPGGGAFDAAVGALYSMAFTVKMASKKTGRDYVVCKLEGIYPTMTQWTLLIRTPDFIDEEALRLSREKILRKDEDSLADQIKLITLQEGKSAQLLHVGPYSEEQVSIDKLMAYIKQQGLCVDGKHHEIYLSDPRRIAPEKLKTILRYPVR